MPRRLRAATGGLAYHVINRAVARLAIFEKDADYDAFDRVIRQTHERLPTRLLAYVLMPNHFHCSHNGCKKQKYPGETKFLEQLALNLYRSMKQSLAGVM